MAAKVLNLRLAPLALIPLMNMLLFNVLPFIGVYIDFHIFNFEHQVKGKIEKLKLKKKTGTCGTCGGTCTCVATCVQHVILTCTCTHM